MNTIKLSEIRKEIEVEKGYFISVTDSTAPIMLVVGQKADTAAASFEHPNLSAKVNRIHHFKHYRKNGSKFWTRKAGIDFYFGVPRDKVEVILEKGYSYVPIIVNGVKTSLNVSGGSCGDNWSDHVGTTCHTVVGLPIRDMKRIAEVSIPVKIETEEMDAADKEAWSVLANEKKYKKDVVANFKIGKKTSVVLGNDVHSSYAGQVIQVDDIICHQKCNGKKIKDTNRIRWFSGGHFRIKPSQIDWVKTHKLLDENKL